MNDDIPDRIAIRKGAFAYRELAQVIRSWIANEKIAKGEKLPTEDKLMKMFGVGRHTVRAGIANLVNDGLVERFAGRGTFVKKIDLDTSDWRIRSLEDIIDQSFPEAAEFQEIRHLQGSEEPEAARALGLALTDTLVQVGAIRRKNGRPYTCSKIFLPFEIGKQLNPNLKDEIVYRPLVRIIERKCGLHCTRAVQETSATLADAELSQSLEVPVGSPLLTLKRTYFTTDEYAFEHVRLFCLPELYSHTVEFSRGPIG